jgi:limonene-1,2-epoxide hydrolase
MPGRFTRGRFLGAGLMAAVALPRRAAAAEPTAAEKANLALVTGFCASFAGRDMSKITAFLADNCVYRVTETTPPVTGKAAIERIRTYVERSTKIEFKILESWVKGSVVVNERVDSFVSPQRTNAYHLTGVFFVKDGRIAEWTDYVIATG